MKIALCLSGQPRFLDEGYAHIYEHLLSKYSLDCFIHTWWSPDMGGRNINTTGMANPQGRSYIFPHNTLEKMSQYYSPKAFIHESQKSFNIIDGVCFQQPNKTSSVQSMWYSVKMANQLKSEYEKKNGFVYDIVIRSRTDVMIYKLVLDNLTESDCIYTDCVGAERDFPNDQLAVSTSHNMDYYASLYDNLISYRNEGFIEFVGERLLRHHIEKINIKLRYTTDIANDIYKNDGGT